MPHLAQNTRDREKTFVSVVDVIKKAAGRADEFDANRAIPEDIFDELEATGVFQALTPRKYGGLELSLGDVNGILAEGGRASGSLGWVLMIHIQQSLAIGTFRQQVVLDVMRRHPRLRIRGAAAPKGRAVPTEGGYRVSGTWPFASGGPAPHIIGANCMVVENGKPQIGDNGIPRMLLVWVPSEKVEFLDTWHVLGMRGTDSRDFSMTEVFVTEEWTSDLFNARNWFDTPAARLPLRVALSPGHAAVAIGIAQGALDEIVALSKTKTAAMNPGARLKDDPVFRDALGECELRLSASQALLEKWTAVLEKTVSRGEPLSPTQIMMGRSMTGYITSECKQVVSTVFSLAGSSSVYNSSPFERRLRDISVAGQHISAFRENYRTLGAALLDEELSAFELLY